MPITGISDQLVIPRLGKIHLGIKVQGQGETEYPKATEYFVVPPEVAEVYGEKPTSLNIMLPTEDPNQFAQQWLRCYGLTYGLVCRGDGITCRRKVDLHSGGFASRDTKDWGWEENLECPYEECEKWQKKHCRQVMNLQFLLPDVPGLGVWQIDTGSFYSIRNINSMVVLLRDIIGRVSMLMLTLKLGPIQVSPPGISQKTVHIMHLDKDIKLGALIRLAELPLAKMLMPEPEAEDAPADLFLEKGLEDAEAPPITAQEVENEHTALQHQFIGLSQMVGWSAQKTLEWIRNNYAPVEYAGQMSVEQLQQSIFYLESLRKVE